MKVTDEMVEAARQSMDSFIANPPEPFAILRTREDAEAWRVEGTRRSIQAAIDAAPHSNRIEIDLAGGTAHVETLRALADVMAERVRQITREGFDAWHDDNEHEAGDLAQAAACYAIAAAGYPDSTLWRNRVIDQLWPFRRESWKPRNPRRDLVRAAALILAEIERMYRVAAASTPKPPAACPP